MNESAYETGHATATATEQKPLEDFDFDAYERRLEDELHLKDNLETLNALREETKNFGNPENIGETIEKVVWDQFKLQLGVDSGTEFIDKHNNGLRLDLRVKAHTQTTEDFAAGKINERNTVIDYQQRYDDWQAQFQKNEDGTIKTRYDNRSGTYKPVLTKDARKPYDDGRPQGTKTTHMDHTVPAAEVIRDAEAAAHLTQQERLEFANGEKNLNPMDASANQSKGDSTMEEWLASRRDGKSPAERFGLDEEELRKKDKEAREEYTTVKGKGKQKSQEAARQSRNKEAWRISKDVLKNVLKTLLANFLKEVVKGLVAWFRAAERTVKALVAKIKEAFRAFLSKLGEYLKDAAKGVLTTIVTAIIGPIARVFTKVWGLLKQGYQSCKQAIAYLRDPANRAKPLSEKMLHVGQIVIAGLSGIGAIALGGVFEGVLMNVPGFAVEIPLLGSLASIIGLFLGGLVAGVLGALAIHALTNAIKNRQEAELRERLIAQHNEVAKRQQAAIDNRASIARKMAREVARRQAARDAALVREGALLDDEMGFVSGEVAQTDSEAAEASAAIARTVGAVAETEAANEELRKMVERQNQAVRTALQGGEA